VLGSSDNYSAAKQEIDLDATPGKNPRKVGTLKQDWEEKVEQPIEILREKESRKRHIFIFANASAKPRV